MNILKIIKTKTLNMVSIGWIDFSPSHRDKVGAALDLLAPEGMVDELGLGTLRDSMANQLFPGISTIQTRAKYFFIVPYILFEYQKLIIDGHARGKSASKYLEQREYEIMWHLADKYRGIKNSGVIGATKYKPQKIVRRPSVIYWNGINMYNLLNSGGLSAEVFMRKATKGEFESLLSQINDSDEAKDDVDAEHENIFNLRVFPPQDWDEDLSLDLTQEEAEQLNENVVAKAKGKLISYLLTDRKSWEVCSASSSFMEFAKAVLPSLPSPIKEEVILAHDFSELMFGAHTTYNSLLQKKAFNDDIYEEDWIFWLDSLKDNMIAYDQFSIEKLLAFSPRTRKSTVSFVKNWIDLVYKNPGDIQMRNALVEEQEFNVKRSKSRLKMKKFDDVRQESWVGFHYLDYRFRNVRTIINDIKQAL